ncbi:predicted MFS family arabinose efflux permease [Streptomyces sp. TLI_55]|uniref:MFS transporter n=1 Tax=Streptomyces sp. TLI_55 TaxID=1938861 RepID=UPI000BCBE536|nr:MFS transporter [Streptomyces sp. TLI_55]SNX63426.1 predicted MFS family arabinose efflux permease [Streptomyces sp. TLI_55]
MSELSVPDAPDATEAEDQETAQGKGMGREFRLLWSADLIATLGDGALVAAIPLLAKSLTSDPSLVAGVATARTLPWLLLALIGGAIVDRFDRRRLMVGAQIAQVALVAVVAVIATFDLAQIWMLYVLAFGVGCAEILFTGASQALVPTLVKSDHLEAANGRLVATASVSREFAGPPLGAALFAFAIPLPFWLNAIAFFVSLLLLSRIRATGRPPRPEQPTAMRTEIAEGLRWLAKNRLPRTLTLIAGSGNFCESMALATLVLFSHDVLGIGDRGYGLLLAAMAIGGVIGGLVSNRVVDRFGARQVAIGVQVVCPLAWLAIGLVGRDPVTVVALFTLFSIALSMWNVVSWSVRQRLIPNELMGRVSGAGRMFAFGAMPLGALVGGFVADWLGLVAPWIIGGVLSLLVAAFALPALRKWDGE